MTKTVVPLEGWAEPIALRKPSDRRGYIGGSTAAACLNLDPFRSPLDAWHEIRGTGEQDDDEVNEPAELGHVLEPALAAMFERREGKVLLTVKKRVMHPVYRFIGGDIDRIVQDENALAEIKTTGSVGAVQWGKPELGEVPDRVRVQTQLYMGLSERDLCYTVRLAGGWVLSYDVFPVDFSQSYFEDLVERLVQWWGKHIIMGEPPEPRSEHDARRLHDSAAPKTFVLITQEQLGLVGELNELESTVKKAEARKSQIELDLMKSLGDTGAMGDGLGELVRWPDRRSFDAEKFAKEQPALFEQFSETKLDGTELRKKHAKLVEKYMKPVGRAKLKLTKRGKEVKRGE